MCLIWIHWLVEVMTGRSMKQTTLWKFKIVTVWDSIEAVDTILEVNAVPIEILDINNGILVIPPMLLRV